VFSERIQIHRVDGFRQRFVEAVKREKLELRAGPVTYFDPTEFSGGVSDPVFAKRHDFSWQREYRYAVDRHVQSPEPYVLDVGPLEDICTIVDPSKINDSLTILPPSQN
jgi:hypothetical protein